MKVSSQHQAFFYLVLLFAAYIAYVLLKPYLGVVVFAFVTVVMFKPIYDLFFKWLKGRLGVVTTLTIITILFVLLVPVLAIVNVTIQQTFQFSKDISSLVAGENVSFTSVINQINSLLKDIPYASDYQLTEAKIIETAQGVVKPVGTFMANQAVSLGSSSAEWLVRFILFLALLGVIFPAYPKLVQLIKDLSPLDDELDQKYVDRVTAMTRAMVKGIFVIAVAQGLTAGLFLWIAGVKYVFFWTVLAIFFSILPLGANVIAIPIGIVLLVMGDIWQGVLVILGSMFVVSNIDNLLRPRLVAKEAELNSALVLLSAFGGLKLFGFLGVIYGPVIMIFLITTVEIYLEHYRQVEEAQ
jgi:predicted PurR-regulated permease PerM